MDVSDFSDLSQVLLYQLVDDPLKGLRHLLHRPAIGALAIKHYFSTCYPPLMNLETRQYISSIASFPNPFKNTGKSICMGTLSELTKQSNQKAFTSVLQMNDENLRNVDCPGFQENACVFIHIATVRTIDGYQTTHFVYCIGLYQMKTYITNKIKQHKIESIYNSIFLHLFIAFFYCIMPRSLLAGTPHLKVPWDRHGRGSTRLESDFLPFS